MTVTDTATATQRHADADVKLGAARWLDGELLATPTFTIDAENERIAGHRTVAAARAAVELGRAASWVATVRPGVVAVDVDVDDDETAAAVLHPLMVWCDDHSVWSFARRSGGGRGRWHLFAVAADLADELRAVIEDTRAHHGLTSREVDVRRAIRPLSAPHRRTGVVEVPEDVERAAADLVAAPRRPGGGRQEPGDVAAVAVARPALTQPVCDLPAGFWRDVRRPHPRGEDRSAVEFAYTVAMVRAGLSEAEAWAVVEDPAHLGLVRSRRRGRAWWRTHSWNAVEPVERTPLAPRTGVSRTLWRGAYDWHRLVIPAALGLRRVWDRWGTRERHTIDHVLAAVADRFTRRGLAPQPLALRSLHEDTGLAIDTIRKALAALVEAGFLERWEPEEYRDGRAAHVYALVIDALDFAGASVVVSTPSSYAPPPCDPTWLASPRGSLSAWLTAHFGGSLTRHAQDTCVPWLASRKLLRKDGTPRPLAPARVPRPRAGLRLWKALRSKVREERQEFRAFLATARDRARARWEEGRTRARERAAALDVRRHAAWWASLPEDERARRRAHYRAWYAGLCPEDQRRRRAQLAERRDLADRGQHWTRTVTVPLDEPSVEVTTAPA